MNISQLPFDSTRRAGAWCGSLSRAASRTARILSIPLLVGLSLLSSGKALAQGQPVPVEIILDNVLGGPGSFGPFTATGGLNTSGFNVMDVRSTQTGTLH
jgi:hypothetical protein